MKKPQPKSETKIVRSDQGEGVISFYASDEATSDFEEFGLIETVPRNGIRVLTLDRRYDFNEVLEYIINYQSVVNRVMNYIRACNKHAK